MAAHLLLACNGTNGSTTITDTARVAHTITAHGDAEISTTQSKFGGASLKMTAAGSGYISLADSDYFKPGLHDFEFSAWIYTTSLATEQCIVDFLIDGGLGQRANAVVLVLTTAGKLNFFFDGSYRTASSGTISINTWTKIDFFRVGGVFKYCIGGTLDANTTTVTASITSGGLSIGRLNDSAGDYFNGYMDDIVLLPYALHTASYTPSGSAFSESNDPVFFINCEGANGSTTFTDTGSIPATITAHGDAKISTLRRAMGSGSLSLDGIDDYLSIDAMPRQLGWGDITIGLWVYQITEGIYLDFRLTEDDTGAFAFGSKSDGLFVYCAAYFLDNISAVTENYWRYVELVKKVGGGWQIFNHGVSIGTDTMASGRVVSKQAATIGSKYTTAAQFFEGNLDNIKMWDYVVHSGNFTPEELSDASKKPILFVIV